MLKSKDKHVFDHTLALACLLSNFDGGPPCSLAAFQQLGVSLELLDPRETRYVFVLPDEFKTDLTLLRNRYHELRDAPPLCDGERFPSKELCSNVIAFNRAHAAYLEERRVLFPDEDWTVEALAESERIRQVYDLCRDVKCEYFYVSYRRKALIRLRDDFLGGAAYYAGILPPPVPVFTLRRID